jgi:hypothetical protein
MIKDSCSLEVEVVVVVDHHLVEVEEEDKVHLQEEEDEIHLLEEVANPREEEGMVAMQEVADHLLTEALRVQVEQVKKIHKEVKEKQMEHLIIQSRFLMKNLRRLSQIKSTSHLKQLMIVQKILHNLNMFKINSYHRDLIQLALFLLCFKRKLSLNQNLKLTLNKERTHITCTEVWPFSTLHN